jgi:F-type H+-transporting ATPase subunit b
VATVVGFVLLLVLLGRMAGPGVGKHFSTRTAHIAEQYEQAERQLTDAQQIRDDYARRIGSIEVEHRQRLDAAVRDADAARADIIADAQAAAKALRRRSEEEIAREHTKQRILLRQQIVQITVDAAEQSIRELETETSQRKLIAEFINQIGANAANGHSPVTNGAATERSAAPAAAVSDAVVPPPAQTQRGA